ncbi:ArsI/CadI family heavy metal resistance metalloenzyme [Zoogloea sp.]|uniref:ArsI/CadI family heavy metal resistance metalloenzyme n=1 Tax=Zoogloea sp. TaxID=49181 RepID=UPI0035B476D4
MKRLHVHISVENLQDSVRFYSAVFAAEPSVLHPDYAKWMLDDPRVNFAISQRGSKVGLDHLGIQAETPEELAELGNRLEAAALPHVAQPGSTCCYARSDKHWSVDPSGIPWESFHTLESIPTYGAPVLNILNQPSGGEGCGCPSVPGKTSSCC